MFVITLTLINNRYALKQWQTSFVVHCLRKGKGTKTKD